MGPSLGAKLLSQVLLCFLFSFVEASFVHWAHGIKDTNTLDVGRDDYLLGSSNMQIQHRNIYSKERGLCGQDRGLLRKKTL